MESEFERLSKAYLSLQRVQRAVPPRTRRGSAELRTFSVKSRRVDLYPRVRACVESGLGEGSAEGRQRACDALKRLEAYEQFCTPLPEELGGVKAYQGDGDVVEVRPIKRRVVVDLTGGPDSGNEQRERASGRWRSRARAATVKAEGEVSSVAAGEHEEDLDDGGGDPKPAEDEDEDEDLDVGGGDPKPAEDEDEDDLVGGRADSLTGYDAGRPAASSPIMNTVACAKAAAARVQQAEEHTCVAKEAECVARAIAAEASAEAKRLRGELRVSKRRCAAAEASLSAERDQLERARETLANWRKGADERREHEAAQRWKQVVAAEKLAKRYEQLQNKNNEHMRKAQALEKGLRAENASLRRRLEAESLSQNQGKRDAKFFQQQLEAAKAQHTLQLQEAVSLARRQWSKKGGEELARKTQEVTSLTASLAREARIVAELRRALKDAEKAARGGSGGEVLRPSQREETLASRLSAAEARAAGAEALASDLQAANRALEAKQKEVTNENERMATAAEVPAEAVLCAVVAHAGATLGARDVASAAGVSRACRAAVGAHGVVRAALGSQDAGERVQGCKVVAARVWAGEGEDEGEAASAAALLRGPFDALLEALLRDGDARVRRAAARALWVLGKGKVAPERARAIAEALDGEALFTLEGHGNFVSSVCFSPDGRRVASSCDDGTVRLWDTATGACVRTLEGHSKYVSSVCFSPDGRQLASSSVDRTVRLWDVATGACVKTLEGHGDGVNSVCFSPDGRRLAGGSRDRTVRLWDVETGACVRTLEGHSKWASSVCFSPDGYQLASGSRDMTLRLWDVKTGACVRTLEGHVKKVSSVCFSPDGRQLASSSVDRTVRLWDVATGACVKTLEGHRGWVMSVCFSPDGRRLASGSLDWMVRLWDTETGACVRTLEGHSKWVFSVCFSPDGRMVASGSKDATVRLWLSV